MSKYLSGSAKRKMKIKKDEEIKKLRGSLNIFLVKNNLDNAGKWKIYIIKYWVVVKIPNVKILLKLVYYLHIYLVKTLHSSHNCK